MPTIDRVLEIRMGRTFEALSQRRFKRAAAVQDVAIAATAILPPIPAEISESGADVVAESDECMADTALLDDFSRDNNDVPYIEVGGPKGTPPVYGPLVAPAPTLMHQLPVIDVATLPAPRLVDSTPVWSVTFCPLPKSASAETGCMSSDLVAFHRPDHPVNTQYRVLLAGIAAQHTGPECPLLVFTSVGQGLDTATLLLNLAITRARATDQPTLIIDADRDCPRVATQLGIAQQPGMRELLDRSVPMSVALRPTAQAGLLALPAGDLELPVSRESEARLPDVLRRLRRRFDWIAARCAEWGPRGSNEWIGHGDAVYLVVRRDEWDNPIVEAAHEAIVKSGGKLRGYIAVHDA
jgi:hypothetical protein